MDKRIRGTYKINPTLTPQENITEILKKTMPIRLALNKLQEGTNSSSQESFKMNEITITATGRYKWSTCKDIMNFRRILFEMKKPGRCWGRDSRKSWSVPVKTKENGEKIISFSAVTNIFNELSKLYQESQKVEDKRVAEEQLAKDDLARVKQKSGIPKEISFYHSPRIRTTESGIICEPPRSNYKYQVSLSLQQLDEEQVIKMGSLFQKIIEIKQNKDNIK